MSNNDLRVAMGSDCVVVGAGLPRGYQHPADENGCITNEFGMKMRQGPVYMDVVVHPLANVQTAEEIAAFPFPDPLAEGRYDDAALYIAKYKHDYFIVGDMELTMFDMMQQLVGLEKLLVDMAQGRRVHRAADGQVQGFRPGDRARSWWPWAWTASGPATTSARRTAC